MTVIELHIAGLRVTHTWRGRRRSERSQGPVEGSRRPAAA